MPSYATNLAIVNNTPTKIVKITVSETANYDWDGSSRPDNNITGKSIAPYTRIIEREELNANAASAWYTMELVFEGGDVIRFRNDQYDARRDRGGFIYLNGERSYKYTMIQTTGLDWGTGHPTNMLSISLAYPSYQDWMKYIPESTLLTALTLPGTHDTGTWRNRNSLLGEVSNLASGGALAQCQSLDLRQQLDRGIRFIDVRCAKRDGKLRIYHGAFDQNLEFESDIVRVCEEFLIAHPSETIVMSVKHEGGGDHDGGAHVGTFEEVLDAIVRKKIDALWYTGKTIPTLDTVRGKVVLFRRCRGSYGISVDNWPDDKAQAFSTSGGLMFDVQDAYNMDIGSSIDDKWSAVRTHLERAKVGGANSWFINFSSAASKVGVPAPVFYATSGYSGSGVNNKMFAWLGGQIAGRWGTIVMDFPEYPEHLIPLIISLNQQRLATQAPAVEQACLYKEPNFKGWMQTLKEGRYDREALSIVGNDSASSLKVAKGFMVTLFEHANYSGRFRSFTSDCSNLNDVFNDSTSSVIVQLLDSRITISPVVLFADQNYEGASSRLEEGRYDLEQLGLANDSVTSVRVAPGYKVTLYSNRGFAGTSKTIITDTSFVADFNDATSSVVVEKVCVGNPPMASFGTPPSPAPVVLYRNENFGGSEQWFKEGSFDQNQLSWVGNNTVSSLRVHPGYSVTLYKDSGFRGESITFTGDASFVGSGFNDTTSSLRVSRIP